MLSEGVNGNRTTCMVDLTPQYSFNTRYKHMLQTPKHRLNLLECCSQDMGRKLSYKLSEEINRIQKTLNTK